MYSIKKEKSILPNKLLRQTETKNITAFINRDKASEIHHCSLLY